MFHTYIYAERKQRTHTSSGRREGQQSKGQQRKGQQRKGQQRERVCPPRHTLKHKADADAESDDDAWPSAWG